MKNAAEIFILGAIILGASFAMSEESAELEISAAHQKLVTAIAAENFTSYKSSNGTFMTRVSGAEEKVFDDFIARLREIGCVPYDATSIGENRFATLTNAEAIVSCAYFAAEKIVNIISDPPGALHVRAQDNVYADKGIPTLLTGMKTCEKVAREGMGFIIRLCDGRFVIIDGGMGDPDHVDSNKLMEILARRNINAPQKPVIAAWIFTHLHGDHVGVFNCFSIDHHDEVEIQRFYYNFPEEAEIAKSESRYMLDKGERRLYRYYQFLDCMRDFYPEVPKVKLHTGNKFHAANATFEVLFAQEDMLPDTVSTKGMNTTSLIFKMNVGGQTTLWTGDSGSIAPEITAKNFGGYLKSDILQLPHHGLNGTVAFFTKIDPTYVILAFHEKGYAQVSGRAQNSFLIRSPKMKQLIDTGRGTWTISLPYAPKEGTFDRLPKEDTVNPDYAGK